MGYRRDAYRPPMSLIAFPIECASEEPHVGFTTVVLGCLTSASLGVLPCRFLARPGCSTRRCRRTDALNATVGSDDQARFWGLMRTVRRWPSPSRFSDRGAPNCARSPGGSAGASGRFPPGAVSTLIPIEVGTIHSCPGLGIGAADERPPGDRRLAKNR